MKTVAIFATVHEYQSDGHPFNQELNLRLEHLQKVFNAGVIMEEWTADGKVSCASKYAATAGVLWENIGTPADNPDFETFRFAPINHPAHSGQIPQDDYAPSLCEYGPYQQQENREKQMTKNIVQAMEHHSAGIVIIGIAHVHSMMGKLLEMGFAVPSGFWFVTNNGR